MSYFPMFLDMSGLKVLVIGGGDIAKEKIEKLLDFTTDITIISVDLKEEVETLARTNRLILHKRAYQKGDIREYDIVIVATNRSRLHQSIFEESRDTGVLVNTVDSIEYCDFIFPSYLQKGDLTVAFSTSGASPAFSKRIRDYFEKKLPDSVESFLSEMKKLRTALPKGKERMRYFNEKVDRFFSKYFK